MFKSKKRDNFIQYSVSLQKTADREFIFMNKTSGNDVLGGSEVQLRVRDKRSHFDDIEMSNWPMKLVLLVL